MIVRPSRSVLYALVPVVLLGCTSLTPAGRSADTAQDNVEKAREKLEIAAPPNRQARDPLLLVHYMPWFQAPPVSSGFGWHWHMGFYDPFERDSDGRARIASHYYPLTGPYDSQDPDVLEYQALLMKLSGVGGVIIDWYGIEQALDYPRIHESSQVLFAVMKKAGLKFAVCFEDQSVGKAIEAGTIKRVNAIDSGKAAILWMKDNWFDDDAYLKIDGRPVLLDFGPQFFITPDQWDSLFAGMKPRPLLVTLDNHLESAADGTYPWPPMWAASGGILSPARLVDYLNEYYRKQNATPFLIASAFPGFHDAYAEAHAGQSYGFLDDAGGGITRLTLDAAMMANPDVIQVATWNDYGEGTIVEPTAQKGYRDLEILQELKRSKNPSFPYSKGDLRVPLQVFKLRVQPSLAPETAAKLDQLFASVTAGNLDAYKRLLAELGITGVGNADGDAVERPAAAAPQAAPEAGASDAYAGATNLALGRPVLANNHIYQFTAPKAVDGDVLTYWEGAAASFPNVVTVDLGGNKAVAATRLKLNPKRIWQARIQRMEVLISPDGKDYSTTIAASDYRFDPEGNMNTVTVPLSVHAAFIRLVFSANDGATGGQLAEWEVFGE